MARQKPVFGIQLQSCRQCGLSIRRRGRQRQIGANDWDGYGYNDYESVLAGWLDKSQYLAFNYNLAANVDYLFVAAGDNDRSEPTIGTVTDTTIMNQCWRDGSTKASIWHSITILPPMWTIYSSPRATTTDRSQRLGRLRIQRL